MTHFLRDDHNQTVVDADASANELRVVVVIETFGAQLLMKSDDVRGAFIADFQRIQELRGEYWEYARDHGVTPDKLARDVLREAGKKWGLGYVVD